MVTTASSAGELALTVGLTLAGVYIGPFVFGFDGEVALQGQMDIGVSWVKKGGDSAELEDGFGA